MLINLGIVGTISYLIFLISQVKLGIKNMTNYSYILLISIVCYMIQSFFNLSVVIVSPIFWITMAIHHLSIYDYVEKEGK
jgi:putative inorganic carbon (HCO3(-)) transporter